MSELQQPGGISIEQSTHSALVFNYVKVAVPAVSEDFERAFTFARTQLQLEEVVNTFNLSKEINDTVEDLVKGGMKGDGELGRWRHGAEERCH